MLMRFTTQHNDKGNCNNDCCRSWIVVAERAEFVACPTGLRMKKVRKQATVRTQEGK